MSADHATGPAPGTASGNPPSTDHAPHDDHGAHGSHGSMSSYVTGFVLAVVLTAIPFWLVMGDVITNPRNTALIILGFAVVQIVVHMIFFLHMSPKAEEGWTLLATMFTIVLVIITLSGSLWIMFHLDRNMMPGNSMDEMPFEQQ